MKNGPCSSTESGDLELKIKKTKKTKKALTFLNKTTPPAQSCWLTTCRIIKFAICHKQSTKHEFSSLSHHSSHNLAAASEATASGPEGMADGPRVGESSLCRLNVSHHSPPIVYTFASGGGEASAADSRQTKCVHILMFSSPAPVLCSSTRSWDGGFILGIPLCLKQ